MKTVLRLVLLTALTLCFMIGTALAEPEFTYVYDAASGLYPDDSCPTELYINGNSIFATVEDETLTISSTNRADYLYYFQMGENFEFPDPYVIEARLRIKSGNTSTYLRANAVIHGMIMPNYLQVLYIGEGEIFTMRASAARSKTYKIDTTSDFHTYRLEFWQSGDVSVYYDDELVIEDKPYFQYLPVRNILWGDDTNSAHGVSEWQYVAHNARNLGCKEEPVDVSVDIKPGSCPNPLNTRSRGVISVAVAGTGDYNVAEIDPKSVTLAGVSPLRHSYEDVTAPHEGSGCGEYAPDGNEDLVLKFKRRALVNAIKEFSEGLQNNEEYILGLEGKLYSQYGDISISGEDVILLKHKLKKNKGKHKKKKSQR